ncbi:MAG: hypothetical protein WC357_01130 [Candidatus Omnitrophota bacterium]|jgi:hypothetical protein
MKNKKLILLILGMIAFSFYYLFKSFDTLKVGDFPIHCSLLVILVWLTIKNVKERIFRDRQTFLMMGVGILANILIGLQIGRMQGNYSIVFQRAIFSIIGILFGGGGLYLLGAILDFLYFRVLKKAAIGGQDGFVGGGDVKLMAGVGAFLGPSVIFVLPFWISIWIGLALVYIVLSTFLKRRSAGSIPSAPIHFLSIINFLIFQACVFNPVTLLFSLALVLYSAYIFSES